MGEKRRLVESWREDTKSVFSTGWSGTEFLAFQGCQNPQNENRIGAHAPTSLIGLARGFSFYQYVSAQVTPTKGTVPRLSPGTQSSASRGRNIGSFSHQLWGLGGEERSNFQNPNGKEHSCATQTSN